jgi:hypothetical protein
LLTWRIFSVLAAAPSSGGEALICTTGDAARESDDDQLIALAVDGVSNIRSFSASEILSLPEGQQPGGGARYWAGFYRTPPREGRRGGAARGARPRCLTRRAVAGGAEYHRIRAVATVSGGLYPAVTGHLQMGRRGK